MSPVFSSLSDDNSLDELSSPQFKLATKFWRDAEMASPRSKDVHVTMSTMSHSTSSTTDDGSSIDHNEKGDEDETGSCYSHASAIDVPSMDEAEVEALVVGTSVKTPTTKLNLIPGPWRDEFQEIDFEGFGVGADENEDDVTASEGKKNETSARCWFAESFARREQLDTVAGKSAYASRNNSRKGDLPDTTSESLMACFSLCLVELLDQNILHTGRLTDATRAFSALFSEAEKQVFSRTVRLAVGAIRTSKEFTELNSDHQTTSFGHKAIALRSPSSRFQSMGVVPQSKRSTKSGPSVEVTRKVLLGCADIEECKVQHLGSCDRNAPDSLSGMERQESLDLQLPFGSALLAVLTVLVRMDCEPIYKRRKNRYRVSAVIFARARQDRDGRAFTFSVHVSNNSPSRVAFRRPRFGAFRRVDEYVDLVVDSRLALEEYCSAVRQLC
jgi:hypothetical protein